MGLNITEGWTSWHLGFYFDRYAETDIENNNIHNSPSNHYALCCNMSQSLYITEDVEGIVDFNSASLACQNIVPSDLINGHLCTEYEFEI